MSYLHSTEKPAEIHFCFGSVVSRWPPTSENGLEGLPEVPGAVIGKSDQRGGTQRSSRTLLRELNVAHIMELVRREGAISRAELARRSGLSAPTVSTIAEKLLRRGIFVELETARSSGGRPPVLLSIDPKAGYVVGIKLRGDGLTTVVCDLDAQIVVEQELQVSLVQDPAAAIHAIEVEVRRIIRNARIPRSKVLGVGIGVSGVVDTQDGTCTFSHLLQWRDVEIAQPLRRRLGLSIWVENDVNTLAVAEKWSGDANTARDFIVLTVGRGVGLGIMINRTLYRGANGASGEFGHMVVEPSGPGCECGRFGCLEAVVGEQALLHEVGETRGRPVTHGEMVSYAAAGDVSTLEILRRAGHTLGMALANAITLINPEMLIICGEGTAYGSAFLDPIVASVRSQTFADLGRNLEIKIQQWGNDAWAVGAATLVLRESFSSSIYNQRGSAIWKHEM